MAEKLFVIAEIVESNFQDVPAGFRRYVLKNHTGDAILPPDAVIPESRLRYEVPDGNKLHFDPFDKRVWVSVNMKASGCDRLILDPPAPVDEWEKWVESVPGANVLGHDKDEFKAWMRRCPLRKNA